MRARAPGASLDSLTRKEIMVSPIDSFQIRLAVSGTSCDKYPGRSHSSRPQEAFRKASYWVLVPCCPSRSSLLSSSRPVIPPTS